MTVEPGVVEAFRHYSGDVDECPCCCITREFRDAVVALVAAARVECGRFAFPDEDRPGLYAALVEIDRVARPYGPPPPRATYRHAPDCPQGGPPRDGGPCRCDVTMSTLVDDDDEGDPDLPW